MLRGQANSLAAQPRWDTTFELARREPLDLVVVDLLLGLESGIDVLLRLREDHPGVCRVAMTGFSHARSVEHGPTVPRGMEALPSLSEIKREYMRGLLAMHGGNVTHAAAAAGIDRTTLKRILRGDGKRASTGRPEPRSGDGGEPRLTGSPVTPRGAT